MMTIDVWTYCTEASCARPRLHQHQTPHGNDARGCYVLVCGRGGARAGQDAVRCWATCPHRRDAGVRTGAR
eukprot:3934547-Rhodomonas_salina.4